MKINGDWVPLDMMASFFSGGTPSKSNPAFWTGNIPWVSAKDMKSPVIEDSEDHISPAGLQAGSRLAPAGSTLVLTRGMTLLRDVPICSAQREVAFNQDIKAVVPMDGLDPRFLNFSIRAAKAELLGMVELAGHGTGRLPTDRLKALLLRRPDIEEQRAIADFLGSLDDKIELNRRMNETLEATARAIFKSWFVDFDPVRAKMEGRRPVGISDEIAALFPDSLQDSPLGKIPKGWAVKCIGDLANVVGGTTPSTKEQSYWEGGTHAWATPRDLSGLLVPILLSTERRITDAGLAQIGSGLLPKGTVLLSSRAPIGYLAIAAIPVAINQGFIAMLPKAETSSLFLLSWASTSHEEIVSRANGSTFLEISKGNFRPIPVVSPSNGAMREFDRLARPIYDRIAECARESRTLATVRDTLVPKLISGKLRISDTPKCVAARS